VGRIAAIVDSVRTVLGVPRPLTLDLQPVARFDLVSDLAPQPVDRLLSAMRNDAGPVSRARAMAIPAVQRGRNELCSISTIPLRLYRGTEIVDSPLFRQFDLDIPNVVHMARTVEDLALGAVAWWRVTGQDFDGYPMSVCRVDPGRVSCKRPDGPPQRDDDRFVWVRDDDGRYERVPTSLMIKFDSPNPGILTANARSIRIAEKLETLVERYADNPALREYFTDSDNPDVDPMDDEEIGPWLAEYQSMRSARPFVAWLPSNVKRVEAGAPSPKELLLADLWQQAMVGIANGLGVDPEDIGVSTTSRTYQNADDRRRDKLNRMFAPYMVAITDRLSMGDVTRRGYRVQFDLSDYLKGDPAGRTAYYQAMQGLVGLAPAWIAAQEGLPMSAIKPAAPAAPPAPAADPTASARPVGARFADAGPAFTFDARDFGDAPAPTVDTEARTITGLAVPYNAVADKWGIKYRFLPGSLEYSEPARMTAMQDHVTPVGFHKSITDSKAGPTVALSVLGGPDGSAVKAQRDQLLYDAEHGLYTGLSVGVDFSLDPEDGDVTIDDEGVVNVQRATWRETSITYMPAFDDARVTQVAASLTGGPMKCPHCGQSHAPNIACATFAAHLRNAAPAPAPAAVPPAPAPMNDQATAAQFAAWRDWMAANAPGAPALPAAPDPAGPTDVNPNRGSAHVDEPMPYRYDRKGNLRAGTHDFSSDIAAAYNPNYKGDIDPVTAGNRIGAWLKYAFGEGDGERHLGRLDVPAAARNQFAITPANVVNLNYPANHPEMYVDQLDYLYPMYQEFDKGTLETVTPFVLPKFNSSSGLVTDHVTGTEPTPGAYTATAQTITPSALSGKVEITREVFDQGGNPQASGLIWRQMVRGWYEGIETAIQAFLVANAASITDINLGVAVTDAVMDQALATAITALQYIRGGDRYNKVFTQIDLYQKLAKAVDTTGRPLYPTLGAMNASGSMGPAQNYLNVRGKTFVPEWATAATGSVAASSWMIDPDVFGVWVSTPQRLDLQWRVAWVDLGIWGYKALAITDFTRTRELVYDPV
jgi:portal protein